MILRYAKTCRGSFHEAGGGRLDQGRDIAQTGPPKDRQLFPRVDPVIDSVALPQDHDVPQSQVR